MNTHPAAGPTGPVERVVAGGNARIEPETDGFLVTINGTRHSHVDLADPTRLRFEYMRRIADVIDLCAPQPRPLTVLHVGGAGLALPRYVAATRPRSRQLVLEPDEALIGFVREHLPLPKAHNIRVRVAAAPRDYAGLRPQTYDLVVVDAFTGRDVPTDVVTPSAFDALARILRPPGVVVVNVAGTQTRHEQVAVTMTAALGPAGLMLGEARVLSGAKPGNVVLISGRVPAGLLIARGRRAQPPYRAKPLA